MRNCPDTQDAWASGMFWSLLLSQCQLAEGMMRESDPYIVLHLCLEYAEQRKLSIAFDHEKKLIKLEGGSSVSGYILLARILSAQQKFVDAELVIDAALDQSGKWDQGELLRTKAKLRIAQGKLKNAVETYTFLLAVLQVQNKSLGTASKVVKVCVNDKCRIYHLDSLITQIINGKGILEASLKVLNSTF